MKRWCRGERVKLVVDVVDVVDCVMTKRGSNLGANFRRLRDDVYFNSMHIILSAQEVREERPASQPGAFYMFSSTVVLFSSSRQQRTCGECVHGDILGIHSFPFTFLDYF